MAYFFLGLAVFLVVITAWMTVLILRRRRKSLFSMHERPVPIETVWDEWLEPRDRDDAERARRSALYANVTPRHRDAVRESLLAFEKRALSESEPLLAIRRELMDSIDRRMMNSEILNMPEDIKQRLRAESDDVIASDDETRAYLAANELRLEILREYAARRYADRAPQDWFDIYEYASTLKQRTSRNYITRSLKGELTEEGDSRQQAISLVDSQLRAHLLKVAPGTQFDKLPGGVPGTKPSLE